MTSRKYKQGRNNTPQLGRTQCILMCKKIQTEFVYRFLASQHFWNLRSKCFLSTLFLNRNASNHNTYSLFLLAIYTTHFLIETVLLFFFYKKNWTSSEPKVENKRQFPSTCIKNILRTTIWSRVTNESACYFVQRSSLVKIFLSQNPILDPSLANEVIFG